MSKLKSKKKIGIICTVLVLTAIVIVAVVAIKGNSTEETELVYKETTVQKGNVVYGVTESGSVTVGTVEQDFDLDITIEIGRAHV